MEYLELLNRQTRIDLREKILSCYSTLKLTLKQEKNIWDLTSATFESSISDSPQILLSITSMQASFWREIWKIENSEGIFNKHNKLQHNRWLLDTGIEIHLREKILSHYSTSKLTLRDSKHSMRKTWGGKNYDLTNLINTKYYSTTETKFKTHIRSIENNGTCI